MLKELVRDIVNKYNKKAQGHHLIIDDSLVINVVKDNEVIKHLSINKATTVAELEKMLK